MKVLDKEARVWDVYMGLESTVKNLLTSLRAVNELQNSAVRERHWQQLMNTTKVRSNFCCFVTIPHFTRLNCFQMYLCSTLYTVLIWHTQMKYCSASI